MKLNFSKQKKTIPQKPLPWYLRILRKSQLGLALGETRTKKQPSLFEQEHTLGETKVEDGHTYTLEEGTPGKPRWHRKDEEVKDKKPDKIADKLSDAINQKLTKEPEKPVKPVTEDRTEEVTKPVETEEVKPEPEPEQQQPKAVEEKDTYLPEGWEEGYPGGIATNRDPERGGIVDKQIVSGEWFVVPENEALFQKHPSMEGFATRKEAFDALEAALKDLEQPDDLEEELRHEPELSDEEQEELFNEMTDEGEVTSEPDEEPEKKTRREYVDVGQKIGGAKKDLWAEKLKMGELLRREDFDFDELEKYPELAGKVVKKDHFIPKTAEFAEEMRKKGYDAGAAFLHTKIVQSIAPKPDDSPLAVRQYIEGLDLLDKYLFRATTVDDLLQNMVYLENLSFGYNLPVEAQNRINEINEGLAESNEEYRKVRNKYGIAEWYVEQGDKLSKKTKGEIPTDMQDKYKQYKVQMEEIKPGMERLRKLIDDKRKEVRAIEKQYKEDDNLPLSKQKILGSLGKRFMNVVRWRYRQGSDAFKANVKEAMGMGKDDWGWTGQKTQPRGRVVDRIPKWKREVPEKVERQGESIPRETFKPDDLMEVYGIRGVEYGNWVDEESAKYHTQMAGLAFYDLARVLGVDNKLISYNDRLAMAFGARGSGAALAHYEPGRMVINMTKFNGGGSLAHEWGHFLDNVVSIVGHDGKQGHNSYLSDGSFGGQLPERVKTAAKEMNTAIKSGTTVIREAVEPTDKYKRHRSTRIDSDLQTMSPQGVYDKHSASIDSWEKTTLDNINSRQYTNRNRKQESIDRTTKHATKERRKIANYIASKTDQSIIIKRTEGSSRFVAASKIQGKYFSKDIELFARAFESFIEDELADTGMKNTYLVSGTRRGAEGYFSFNNETGRYIYSREKLSDDDIPRSVYPVGEERERINSAMRNFIEALKEEDMFEKAMRILDDGMMFGDLA